MKKTSNAYKAGYETGFNGSKSMTKAQFTAGIPSLTEDWKEYRKGIRDGKEDKEGGYEYNQGD